MKHPILVLTATLALAIAGVTVPAPASAAATAAADTSATTGVTCKDGTVSAHRGRGACSGHGGQVKAAKTGRAAVKTGRAAGGAAAAPSQPTASASPAVATSTAAAPTPAARTPHTTSTSSARARSTAPAATAAPGGGVGQVWVNLSSKVYHCQGDRWYGKTKSGEYLSESAAASQGFRPDHGKACH